MAFQVNLVNRAYLVHRHRLSAGSIAITAAAIYFGFVVANMIQQGTIEPLRSRLSAAESELGQEKANLEKAVAGQKNKGEPNKQLIEEVKRLEARLELQRELLVALETGGVGNAEGFSKYLTALARRRVEGVWLTTITVSAGDGQINLQGRMTDLELLPAYIRELKNDETLRGQGFGMLELTSMTMDAPSRAAPGSKAAKDAPKDAPKINVVQFRLGGGSSGDAK